MNTSELEVHIQNQVHAVEPDGRDTEEGPAKNDQLNFSLGYVFPKLARYSFDIVT
jgi:hypothetical protein